MSLPPDFQFSQSSLQDYVDCARRFELRYMQQLVWPAVQSEPVAEYERHMRQGSDFHHMIHQHLAGVPLEVLSAQSIDTELSGWWQHYLNSRFVDHLPGQRYPEITLAASLGGHRIAAKYDLIAIAPGERVVILDWKTSRRKPPRSRLQAMLQTVVYPWMLVAAGRHLNGGQPIQPEQVEMVYWFTAEPENPERFSYSQAQYEHDGAHLAGLIREIEARTVFGLTSDTRRCQFCAYRSLCERGVRAGDLDVMDMEYEVDLVVDFNFDQIAEVEF